MRRTLIAVGLLAAIFGALCLNYTGASGAEHHREFAQKHGLPPPSQGIFVLGLACALGGAAVFGFALGRPSR